MKLIKFSLLFLLVILSCNFSSAQEKEQDLTHGINIYLFDGYAVGYRFNESGNTFWRINLDLYANYNDGINNSDTHSKSLYGGDTSSYETKSENSHFSLTLSPQYLYKFYQSKFVDFYSGGGILFGYDRNEYKTNDKRVWSFTGYNYSYSVSNSYSLGIIGILGLEGKLTDNFSVFVESQLSEMRSWTTHSSNSTSISEETEEYRSFSSGKAKGWTTNFALSRAGIIFRF